jgi:hypothetical protein
VISGANIVSADTRRFIELATRARPSYLGVAPDNNTMPPPACPLISEFRGGPSWAFGRLPVIYCGA